MNLSWVICLGFFVVLSLGLLLRRTEFGKALAQEERDFWGDQYYEERDDDDFFDMGDYAMGIGPWGMLNDDCDD